MVAFAAVIPTAVMDAPQAGRVNDGGRDDPTGAATATAKLSAHEEKVLLELTMRLVRS